MSKRGVKLRGYTIDISNASQEDKKRLVKTLKELGEDIYPYSTVISKENSSRYFIYYLGDWCTSSSDYNNPIIDVNRVIVSKNIIGGKIL